MSLIVQKYGGTSVGSPERIRAVARRVAATRRAGHDVVVVVSAMGHTTDELLALAAEVSGEASPARAHPRELDMLLTAGERIAMALLAMAIRQEGVEALSFTGSQAAIITDSAHTAARITEVRAGRVREELAAGRVVIVAGFQGVSPEREVTTLGRGGSDTTAVALAAALPADVCQIYTDVDGIHTADPRRVQGARVIPEIGYDEMLELAAAGAQVMHPRAIEIAARYGVDVRVLSSFSDDDPAAARRGTLITRNPRRMESLELTGITSTAEQAKLTLRRLPAGMGTITEVLGALAAAGVSVDMIFEARDSDGRLQLQLSLAQPAVDDARRIAADTVQRLGGEAAIEILSGLSRLSLVGSGMHNRPGVYASAFRALLEADVPVHAVSTSSISITLLVPTERETAALNALHQAFALELKAPAGGAA